MSRYWRRVLEVWSSFADSIVVLDDASEDETAKIAGEFTDFVFSSTLEDRAWGREAPARRKLFDLAWTHTRIGDYILWLDGDMIPARDPRPLLSGEPDGVLFRLFDLWSLDPLRYREDDFWRGHLAPRLWMIRRDHRRLEDFVWTTRGIHSGHLPTEFGCDSFLYAPLDYSLLHYAYSREDLRKMKYQAYLSVAEELTDFEKRHAMTILDEEPRVLGLPFVPSLSL